MIRKARESDIPRMAEILVFGKRVAYRDFFQDDIGTFQELSVWKTMEEYKGNDHRLEHTLVYDDGIVKGVLTGKIELEEGELCELYVDPFFKRCGIGKELLLYFLETAKRKKVKKIFLWVIKENVSARKFYESNGFIENKKQRFVEGPPVIEIQYVKKL